MKLVAFSKIRDVQYNNQKKIYQRVKRLKESSKKNNNMSSNFYYQRA